MTTSEQTRRAATSQIIHGDCVEVMKTLDHVDIVFADPPYNIGKNYGRGAKDDLRPVREYVNWALGWFGKACSGSWCVWVVTPPKWEDLYYVNAPGDKPSRGPIVWHETFSTYNSKAKWFIPSYRMLLCYGGDTWNPEAIRVPSARQSKYNDKRADPRGRIPANVWTIPRVCGKHKERVPWHPTQLPFKLVERCVLATSNEGDTVLDPFCGSGVTGLVCKKHNRNFIGIDSNEEYVRRATERIELFAPATQADRRTP